MTAKLISLLVIADIFGHYSLPEVKTFSCSDIEHLGYTWIVDADVWDATCTGKRIAKRGDLGNNDPAIPATRVVKIKHKEQYLYVLATLQQVEDLCKNCCTANSSHRGQAPSAVLQVQNHTTNTIFSDTQNGAAGDQMVFQLTTNVPGDAVYTLIELLEGETVVSTIPANGSQVTITSLAGGTHFINARITYNDPVSGENDLRYYTGMVRVALTASNFHPIEVSFDGTFDITF